jgi:hypothetical protein
LENSISLLPQLLNFIDKHRHLTALAILQTVLPDSAVPDTPYSVVETDSTARFNAKLRTMASTLPKEGKTAQPRIFQVALIGIIILLADTFIQGIEVDTMLQSALFDQRSIRNVRV